MITIELLSDIPPSLAEIWWVYHLILCGVIAVSVLLLLILKKNSEIKEAEKFLRKAVYNLKRAEKLDADKKRRRLNTAKNLLRSAALHYTVCVEEKDMFTLAPTLEKVNTAKEILARPITKDAHNNTAKLLEDKRTEALSVIDRI